jgi:hypothetical protein
MVQRQCPRPALRWQGLSTSARHPDFRDSSKKAVTNAAKCPYHKFLGEVDRDTQECSPARKEEISMARLPSAERLSISDDSWGLFLVPIVACVALLISALIWL